MEIIQVKTNSGRQWYTTVVSPKAVEVRDEILSVEKKLVKYLNENKHDSDRA